MAAGTFVNVPFAVEVAHGVQSFGENLAGHLHGEYERALGIEPKEIHLEPNGQSGGRVGV